MFRSRSLKSCVLAGAVLTAALLCATPVAWAATLLKFDPAQTKVAYTVDSLLHTVHGTFQLKSGEIRYDPASGAASGLLVVDARSGKSGNDSRDQRMTKSILEAEKYPEITFAPDRVVGSPGTAGGSKVQLHGTLTLHGTAHEMTIDVEPKIEAGRFTGTATFAVPYVKWGLKNPSTLFLKVNEAVDLRIEGSGTVEP